MRQCKGDEPVPKRRGGSVKVDYNAGFLMSFSGFGGIAAENGLDSWKTTEIEYIRLGTEYFWVKEPVWEAFSVVDRQFFNIGTIFTLHDMLNSIT